MRYVHLGDKGYGSLKVVKLFTFITTDSERLANNNNTRIETDNYIHEALKDTDIIIINFK